MKKLIVIAAGVLVSFQVFAQGQITWRVPSITNGLTGQPIGTGFQAQVYYAPDGPDPGDGGFVPLGASVNLLPGGLMNGGTRTTPDTTAPGASAWFQVRAWEAIFGATYEAAVNQGPLTIGGVTRRALAGMSNHAYVQTGNPPTIPVPNLTTVFQPFTVTVVPEPSAAALSVLGLVSCVLLRRRR